MVEEAGSSPLARGLLVEVDSRTLCTGIIPARAGFTSAPAWMAASRRDHPRSRGVYAADAASAKASTGSSPLARGLRVATVAPFVQSGIIPARAGFTLAIGYTFRLVTDHPRSRGVYALATLKGSGVEGSSPLARGLRARARAGPPTRRIIPARAGFTSSRAPKPTPPSDHPRSRGVYDPNAATLDQSSGSSPLARGLRKGWGKDPLAAGIIPARAGFTASATGPRSWSADHPRSRGVYPTTEPRQSFSGGSSPLARGLPSPAPKV